ncbi:MAG: methylmalonyl Co-A mutase-associated GTPase MeaB [Planctomycetes bacterium]|nr:methylmalonyl Co-A mutase-associated GTPase MeaB [Planctomycetota bacterium]
MTQQRDRRWLARAITLVESTRAEDEQAAERLLAEIAPDTGRALRVGVSGPPGVGKSTFLDALGIHLVGRGHRVAVLAVDPSSPISGGSILADKTRMERLARCDAAFIRPSPGAGALGGVARRTREAMLVCEAAGHDVILVETIGVGQSETDVSLMTDHFLVLALPGAGDELQGLKKGIVELADSIAITKADGDNLARATQAQADLRMALQILHGGAAAAPPVLLCSALQGTGIAEVWSAVEAAVARARQDGSLAARRGAQIRAWFHRAIEERVLQRFLTDPAVRARMHALELELDQGRVQPGAAARRLVEGA